MARREKNHMEPDPLETQRALLAPLLGHYFNECYSQLSLMVPYVWKLAGGMIGIVILITAALVLVIRARRKRKKRKSKERN